MRATPSQLVVVVGDLGGPAAGGSTTTASLEA
jgi:hypothetical protein